MNLFRLQFQVIFFFIIYFYLTAIQKLVCNIFVGTTNVVNHKIQSKFLIEIQLHPEKTSEALDYLEREVLKEFQSLKPQWVLLIFLIAKSFLTWSLIIKSSLFENRIVIKESNANHLLVH